MAGKNATFEVKEPLWCDEEFTQRFPLPPEAFGLYNNPWCCFVCCTVCYPCWFCCCGCRDPLKAMATWGPKVRGILRGSTPIAASDAEAMMSQLQGVWKIEVVKSGGESYVHEQARVNGNNVRMTGGMHNSAQRVGEHRHITVAVQNEPVETKVQFTLVSPRGEVYSDNLGSIIKIEADGRVTVLTFLGGEQLWIRDPTAGGSSANTSAPVQVQMPAPFCTECGTQRQGDNKFCGQCGHGFYSDSL